MMVCKSILIVEDDESIRENIAEALEMEGYITRTAENGLIALNLLRELAPTELPGCIILDLMMPEMDGKTFLDTLARDYPNDLAKIKVIVATAKGSPVRPEQVPLGVERIQKPMELDELYRVVRGHCGEAPTSD